ncbi:MAG TPA: hypothetical protein H9892_00350 [Candidatus Protoclostridium stercorigallinarum]|uniref:4-diphosphocytidyl-2-C-methyl-D-erythritol kinase n=1 Tax=Candidatus Protoclostridium stercorigallinarum TaxID=2838741 RepID=A0A9D1PZ81_9FIRM|nr:hypothetical protein [Candidatus Protoclostridium stercorigallinarum]
MRVKANGKLNLALFVTGSRGGLHTLDGVMHSVDLGDELEITESAEVRVTMRGAECDEKKNTAYRAATLVKERYGLALSADIIKRLPVGGGMGGSSADAAGVLVAAERLLGRDLTDLGAEAGSDVPFMMRGGCARVSGTGDELERRAPLSFTALVVNCGQVDTAACYREFDRMGHDGGDPTAAIGDVCRGIFPRAPFNALLAPARALQPRIAECEELAKAHGMSIYLTGSGGCMFVPDAPRGAEELFSAAGFGCFTVRSAATGVEFLA